MALINQPPRLQLGDAPLTGYTGADTDQVVVIWQTTGSLTGDTFTVEVRPSGGAWTSVTGHTMDPTGVGSRVMHEVEIDGLSYGSTYEYRVVHTPSGGSPVTYQAEFDTRLEAGDTSGFSFAAYGDSADPNSLGPFFEVQSQIGNYDPDFALLLGDNAYESGTHAEFDSRFATGVTSQGTLDWIGSHIDYPAYGNHDNNSGGDGYRDGYSVPVPVAGVDSPVGNPAGMTPELNYSFDYGNAHFVTFDSNMLNSASQLDILLDYVEADLAASTAQWKIVYAHHPVGGAPDKGEGPEDNYWQQVVPRLYDAGVDLFLTGHSHTYSWTYPLTGYSGTSATFVADTDKIYEQGDGLVQVVAGTGGRSLRSGNFGYDFVASGYSTSTSPAADFGFAQVSVTANALVVDYVMADDGTVLDSFRIVNDGSGSGGQGGGGGGPQLSFQNGTGGYTGVTDTQVREASPDTAYGSATSINVDGEDSLGEVQGLVRFDNIFGTGAGQIASTDVIAAATLYLDVFDPGAAVQLYEMLDAWTGNDTWNVLGNGIQANGTEAASSPIATTGGVSTGSFAIDVTASLTAWQANPAANFGWAILPTGTDGVDFNSSETATGPRLVVTLEDGGTPANTAPVAQNDALAVEKDATVTGNLLTNDSDADNDTVTVSQAAGQAPGVIVLPSGAQITVTANGGITYDPNGAFGGLSVGQTAIDSFSYSIDDGNGGVDSAVVNVAVSGGTPMENTFQNGNGGYNGVEDTYLRQASAGTNYGTALELNIDQSDGGGQVHGLLQFADLFGSGSGQIGAGDTIISASLFLEVFNPGDSFSVFEMLTPWSESATWTTMVAGIQTDDTEARVAAVATTGSVSTGTLSIDVTASLAAWQANPGTNFGWALLSNGTNGVDFNSSETAAGPRLVVQYEEGPPANTEPAAADDAFTVIEDAPLSGDLFADNGAGIDSDPDGDALSITAINGNAVTGGQVITLTSGALLTINADGSFSYDQNGVFASLILGESGVDVFTYDVSDGNGGVDQASVSITIAGVGSPPDPSPGDDQFIGTAADDVSNGYGGSDKFLLRYGNDTATGGADADLFIIDGRYINNGDAHTITDLSFADGDTLQFRLFEPDAFDDGVDPANTLQIASGGRTATMNSLEDIVEAHLNGVLQASDPGDGDTLLTISASGEQVTVKLSGILFSALNIPGGPPVDPSPGDDNLVGTGNDDSMLGYGGNDSILMRYGNDTASGGTGADQFKLDGRYVNNGDAHRITDLNFGEGDFIEFRFMNAGTFDNSVDPANDLFVYNNGTKSRFDSIGDIQEAAAHGMMSATDDGFGGTVLGFTVAGEAVTLTLDGISLLGI